MIFRALVLSSFVTVSVVAQCSVCGDGKQVGNPAAVFEFPGQPAVPCDVLQAAGEQGAIQLDQCAFLPGLISDVCGCENAAMLSPTTTPTAASCSVCGEGNKVGNSEAVFIFPGQPAVQCGILEFAGETGLIQSSDCASLPAILQICECEPIDGPITPAPVDPTPAPIDPTPAPIDPTPAPIDATPAPIDATPAPIDPTPAPIDPTPAPIDPTPAPVENSMFTSLPTPEPTPGPTPDVITDSCPVVPSGGCSICGDDKCVTAPDAIFEFAGQPSVACGVLQDAGYEGIVDLNDCTFLPDLVTACECEDPRPNPTPAPVMPTPPTPNPISSMFTPVPVAETSQRPVIPTPSPIMTNPLPGDDSDEGGDDDDDDEEQAPVAPPSSKKSSQPVAETTDDDDDDGADDADGAVPSKKTSGSKKQNGSKKQMMSAKSDGIPMVKVSKKSSQGSSSSESTSSDSGSKSRSKSRSKSGSASGSASGSKSGSASGSESASESASASASASGSESKSKSNRKRRGLDNRNVKGFSQVRIIRGA